MNYVRDESYQGTSDQLNEARASGGISDDKRKQAVDGSQEIWQRYERALATAICEHFDEVNGKSSPAIRIPVDVHSGFFVVTSDGFTYEWQENGQTRILPIGRVVMEQTSHDLSFLFNTVQHLIEGKEDVGKPRFNTEHYLTESEDDYFGQAHNYEVSRELPGGTCVAVLLGYGAERLHKIREVSHELSREPYVVQLLDHDAERLHKVSLLEWTYDKMKALPFFPVISGETFKDDIPYGRLLLQPAYQGVDHLFRNKLLLKRCRREPCNRVFSTAIRQQRYCSPKCKSAKKYEKSLASKSVPKYRSLAAKLNSKNGGFLSVNHYYLDIEEDDILKLGFSKDSLSQMFSEKNRGKFERYGIVVKKHAPYKYSFHPTSKN